MSLKGRAFLGALVLIALCAVAAGMGAEQARAVPARSVTAAALPCDPITRFRAENFSNPTAGTNQFLPLVPGTKLVFEGESEGTPHTVIFIVTDMTKVINGVRTSVYWERDFSDGSLVETELAFRAQDNAGNVWHMGEYPETWEDGNFVEALPWIAGLADAKPGNHMLANPNTSRPKYLQGYAPEVEFLDCAKIYRTGHKVCVPAGCFSNVLVINETSPPEPGSQRKFYAPGIGNIRVTDPIDPAGEFLELVEIAQMDADGMAWVREQAIRLDKRGFRTSETYAMSNPLEGPSSNTAPAASNDSYSMTQGTTLNVAAPGVLGNDTDADGDSLTAAKLSDPANGTLTFNGNGSFSYTPSVVFTGTVTFTYRASDGTANSNTATVTITVNPSGGGGSGGAVTASADTYVRSAAPGENNGAAASLRSAKSGTSEIRSYLKFTVSGLSGAPSSAVLRLLVKDASPEGGAVWTVPVTTWAQGTMTWSNKPALGSLIGNLGNSALNTWVEIDVTSAIAGDGTYSFAVAGLSADTAWFSSKEGTNPPELVVTP